MAPHVHLSMSWLINGIVFLPEQFQWRKWGGRGAWLREKERQMQQDRKMDRLKVLKRDRNHSALKLYRQRQWEHKRHCSPLRHLRNYSVYKNHIYELSKDQLLKSFIWLWSAFVYTLFHLYDALGINILTIIMSPRVIFSSAFTTAWYSFSACIMYFFISFFPLFLVESRCVFVLQSSAAGKLCRGFAEDWKTGWGQNWRKNPVSCYRR